MSTPQVIWWTWVGIIVLSLLDLVIQGHGHNFLTLKIVFGGMAITGAVYALTLWPAVIADNGGVKVRNPIRTYDIPWGAVHGVYLADSVEVQCARPAPKKDKTVYSWALSSPRRTRARAQLRAWQWDQGKRAQPSGYRKMPEQAQSLVRMTTAEIMARELAAMSEEARFRSVMKGVDFSVDSGDDDSGADGPGDDGRKPRSGKKPADDPASRDTASRDSAARIRDGAAGEAKTAGGRAAAAKSQAAASDSQSAQGQEIDPDAPEPSAVDGPPEYVRGTLSWPSLAAVLAPVIAFVVCLVVQ
ncbi:MAG TPA: PH domain-containing protein [Streptosporangiaceae bacterium]|nr:PH domain-containing protein [Streptosporangiaceae bacterium]